MSDPQPVIVVDLSYDRSMILPFTEEGVMLANTIRNAPLHQNGGCLYGGTHKFTPYVGEPIGISMAQMEMNPAAAFHEVSGQLARQSSGNYTLEKKISDQSNQSKIDIGEVQAELNLLKATLRGVTVPEDGVKSGDSAKTRSTKRNAALKQAARTIQQLQDIGAADG